MKKTKVAHNYVRIALMCVSLIMLSVKYVSYLITWCNWCILVVGKICNFIVNLLCTNTCDVNFFIVIFFFFKFIFCSFVSLYSCEIINLVEKLATWTPCIRRLVTYRFWTWKWMLKNVSPMVHTFKIQIKFH
jgi:hypothetical protein